MEISLDHLSASREVFDDEDRAKASHVLHVLAAALVLGPLARATGISKKRGVALLHEATVTLAKGSSTLVIGGVGSGKTTLLRAACGFLAPAAHQGGRVLWDGVDVSAKISALRCTLLAHYLPATDENEPCLTVRESLQFVLDFAGAHASAEGAAAAAAQVGAQPPPSDGDGGILVDELLRLLQLADVADRRVGSLSRAQQRLVSIAEAAVSAGRRGKLLALDQVTDFLSADVADALLQRLTAYFRGRGVTLLCSAHEPSGAQVALFDSLILLHAGCVIYNGPTDRVMEYLSAVLHLQKPATLDVGTFLQMLAGDPIETALRYSTDAGDKSLLRGRFSAVELAAKWSAHGAWIAPAPLAVPSPPEWFNDPLYAVGPARGFAYQLGKLLPRNAKVILRNPAHFAPMLVVGFAFGVILGVFFYNTPRYNPGPRTIVAMMLCLAAMVALSPTAKLGASEASVATRQIGLGWYGASAYILSYAMVRLAMGLVSIQVPCLLLYFMVGFSPHAANFFFFELAFLGVCAYSGGLYLLLAMSGIGILPALFLGLGGFVAGGSMILPSHLPSSFANFLYWLNPISWFVRSVMVSEFQSPEYDELLVLGPVSVRQGDYYALNLELRYSDAWKWAGIGYTFGFGVLMALLAVPALNHRVAQVQAGTARSAPSFAVASSFYDLEAGAGEPVQPGSGGADAASSEEGKEEASASSSAAEEDAAAETAAGVARQDGAGPGAANKIATAVVETALLGPRQQYSLAWCDVSYSPSPRSAGGEEVLSLCSGLAPAGCLTGVVCLAPPAAPGTASDHLNAARPALPQGRALLTLLAGRPTLGVPTGSIALLSTAGGMALPSHHARLVALTLQDDAHAPYETVLELLWVAANLRGVTSPHLGGFGDRSECQNFLQGVIEACELQGEAHSISSVACATPSVAARVRIALELAARPAVLLVEDPTSQTDDALTRAVMRTLRRAAAAGYCVLVTLNEPRSEAALSCTCIAMLAGPRQLYFGPTGGATGVLLRAAIDQAVADASNGPRGAAAAAAAAPARPPVPSATGVRFILHANIPMDVDLVHRAATVFAAAAGSDGPPTSGPGGAGVAVTSVQAAVAASLPPTSILYQLAYMQFRLARDERRNVPLNLNRNIIFIVMGVFLGILFQGIANNAGDIKGTNTLSALIFFLCSVGASTCCSSVMSHYHSRARPWVYKERAAKMIVSEAFSIAMGLADLVWLAISSLLLNVIAMYMAGFDPSRLGFHLLTHILLCYAYAYFGQLLAGASPNAVVMMICYGLFAVFNLLLAGNFLPVAIIPGYWAWVNQAVPIGWAIKAIIMNDFYCEGAGCPAFLATPLPGETPQMISQYDYLVGRFQWTADEKWEALGNLAYCCLAYRIMTVVAWRVHYGAAKA